MAELDPETSFEQKMRNEVRRVREAEERQALERIREGYRHARQGTMARMDQHTARLGRLANRMLAEKISEITEDERQEEESGKSHPKDHGMKEFADKMLEFLADEREKERAHVNKDMDQGDKQDYERAKSGMEENQEKDERQIVELTRKIMDQRKKSWFSEAIYPGESGLLQKAIEEDNHKPETVHRSVTIEFPRKRRHVKDFEEESMSDLKSHPVFDLIMKPQEGMNNSLSGKKLRHIANVSSTMGRIALLNPSLGLNPDMAWLAGSLHDLFDESSLRNAGTDESRRANPKWFWVTGHDHHGALAAHMADSDSLIDPEWSDAIRHHSTGIHGMTPHMKVMLLADGISPDRGNSSELKELRHAAFHDPDTAIQMMINALHHSVVRGHGQNKLRDGVTYDPFQPPVKMLRMYRFINNDVFNPERGSETKRPKSFAEMAGIERSTHNPYGKGVLDLHNETVQHILDSAFSQIDESKDKDKPEAFARWLTARNLGGAMFRNILPGIWPLVEPRYGQLVKEASRRSDGKSDVTMPDIAALSKLLGAGGGISKEILRRDLNRDWLAGKPGAKIFARIIVKHPIQGKFVMPAREMHKSMGNIENLLPETLQRPLYNDWHIGDRAL